MRSGLNGISCQGEIIFLGEEIKSLVFTGLGEELSVGPEMLVGSSSLS